MDESPRAGVEPSGEPRTAVAAVLCSVAGALNALVNVPQVSAPGAAALLPWLRSGIGDGPLPFGHQCSRGVHQLPRAPHLLPHGRTYLAGDAPKGSGLRAGAFSAGEQLASRERPLDRVSK